MPSTRPEKRTKRPYRVQYDGLFDKDWKRLVHSGRHNMQRLTEVMMLIASNGGPLPADRLDHALQGKWVDHRECHIGGDFLLIYRMSSDDTVTFVRAGSHADLFE